MSGPAIDTDHAHTNAPPDIAIWSDDGGTYYADGPDGIIASGTGREVIQTAHDSLPDAGGEISLPAEVIPIDGTLTFNRSGLDSQSGIKFTGRGMQFSTTLRCTAAGTGRFIDLEGASHYAFRDLNIQCYSNADYGVFATRDPADGGGAGNHEFRFVRIANSNKAGIVSWGSENVYLSNCDIAFGNPVAVYVSSYAPASDVEVVGAQPFDDTSTSYSTGGVFLQNTRLGHPSGTTRACLIVADAFIRAQGGMFQTDGAAEAAIIIDTPSTISSISSCWFDGIGGPAIQQGTYDSSTALINMTGCSVRYWDGATYSAVLDFANVKGSYVFGNVCHPGDATVEIGGSCRRSVFGQLMDLNGNYLTINNNSGNRTKVRIFQDRFGVQEFTSPALATAPEFYDADGDLVLNLTRNSAIEIGPVDLGSLGSNAREDGKMNHHNGASSITADGGSTSATGYYVWSATDSEWKAAVQY